jgi:hypothetical protein
VHLLSQAVSRDPGVTALFLTVDEIGGKNENILKYVGALRCLVEDTSSFTTAYKECAVAFGILFDGLLPLLFANLIDRLDPFQLIVRQVPSSDCAIPRYLVRSDMHIQCNQ